MESNWLKQNVNDPDLRPADNAAWRALLGLSGEEVSALPAKKALAIRSKTEKEALTIWNKLDTILKPHRIPLRFGLHRGPKPRHDYLLTMDLVNAGNSKLLSLLKKHQEKVFAVLLLHLLHHERNEKAALLAYGNIQRSNERRFAWPEILAGRKSNKAKSDGGKAGAFEEQVVAQWVTAMAEKVKKQKEKGQKRNMSKAANEVRNDLMKNMKNKNACIPSVSYLRRLNLDEEAPKKRSLSS